MSKVQGRDANLFSDLASTTIAGQLESRLKELERNIAVARQFIKLADECYSQVKHEWELLQQDIGVRNVTASQTRLPSSLEERADKPEIRGTVRREKKNRSESQRKKTEDSPDVLLGPEDHAEPSNEGKPSRKQSEASSQNFKHGKKAK